MKTWVGPPRIHGELRMLGVEVSERTVSRLLESRTRPPSQTWKTFLTNHLATAASMDFSIFTDLSAAPGAAGNEQDHLTIELVVRSPI
jgi:hypothetical protein